MGIYQFYVLIHIALLNLLYQHRKQHFCNILFWTLKVLVFWFQHRGTSHFTSCILQWLMRYSLIETVLPTQLFPWLMMFTLIQIIPNLHAGVLEFYIRIITITTRCHQILHHQVPHQFKNSKQLHIQLTDHFKGRKTVPCQNVIQP